MTTNVLDRLVIQFTLDNLPERYKIKLRVARSVEEALEKIISSTEISFDEEETANYALVILDSALSVSS